MARRKKIEITGSETVEEFLARGGEGCNLPYIPPETSIFARIRVKSPMPVHQMNLDEGAHFFAQGNKSSKKTKEKNYANINWDLIPESLRKQLKIEES
jgi:hypothetical protein